jgi:hypothetical protein
MPDTEYWPLFGLHQSIWRRSRGDLDQVEVEDVVTAPVSSTLEAVDPAPAASEVSFEASAPSLPVFHFTRRCRGLRDSLPTTTTRKSPYPPLRADADADVAPRRELP